MMNPMPYTGEQKREYQRIWFANRRAAFFADKTCAVCGSTQQLQLDHKDAKTKKYSTAALWSMSLSNPNRVTELAKCQVLCKKHHLEKTLANKEGARGEQTSSHKFTTEQVKDIRRMREEGMTYAAIANLYPFVYDKKTIWWVVNHDWQHIT